jgi:hypothetical protein
VSHWRDERETPCEDCGKYHDRPSNCGAQTSLNAYSEGEK